jgi:hypothetical protein
MRPRCIRLRQYGARTHSKRSKRPKQASARQDARQRFRCSCYGAFWGVRRGIISRQKSCGGPSQQAWCKPIWKPGLVVASYDFDRIHGAVSVDAKRLAGALSNCQAAKGNWQRGAKAYSLSSSIRRMRTFTTYAVVREPGPSPSFTGAITVLRPLIPPAASLAPRAPRHAHPASGTARRKAIFLALRPTLRRARSPNPLRTPLL